MALILLESTPMEWCHSHGLCKLHVPFDNEVGPNSNIQRGNGELRCEHNLLLRMLPEELGTRFVSIGRSWSQSSSILIPTGDSLNKSNLQCCPIRLSSIHSNYSYFSGRYKLRVKWQHGLTHFFGRIELRLVLNSNFRAESIGELRLDEITQERKITEKFGLRPTMNSSALRQNRTQMPKKPEGQDTSQAGTTKGQRLFFQVGEENIKIYFAARVRGEFMSGLCLNQHNPGFSDEMGSLDGWRERDALRLEASTGPRSREVRCWFNFYSSSDPDRDPLRVGGRDLDPFGVGGGNIFNPFNPRGGIPDPGAGIPGGLPRLTELD
ncbi:unnamed protein product [Nesidiocoris tenuis]|uniref:Uncharacterized protein n=1 Tax=Nesidiocoris tenuis TaxID=355587 RepID=A0A6H5HAM9_9HEMI|nr:unnamed protein product [Nesidiocoris tenuis]